MAVSTYLRKLYFIFLCLMGQFGLSFSQGLNDIGNDHLLRREPSFDYEDLARTDDNKINSLLYNDNELTNAFLLLEEGKINDSKVILNNIIRTNPEYGGAYYYRGLCYKRGLKIDSAIVDFKRVLSSNAFQFYGPSHLELGFLYLNIERNFQKANASFSKALKFLPDNSQVYYAFAYLNYIQLKYPQAIDNINKSIENDSMFIESYYLLSQIQINQFDYEAARSTFDKILEISPNDIKAKLQNVLLNLAIGELQESRSQLEEILAEDVDNEKAHFLYGHLCLEEGEYIKGFNSLSRSINLLNINENQFGISLDLDLRTKMLFAIQYVAKEIDTYSQNQKQIAKFLVDEFDWGASNFSSLEYQKCLIGEEILPTGIYMLVSVLAEKKRNKTLWESTNLEILSRDTSVYHSYMSLGRFYEHTEQFDEAVIAYSRMIELNDEIVKGYKLRGKALVEAGSYALAIKDLDLYLGYNKIDYVALENRAIAYYAYGSTRRAIDDFELVISLFPNLIVKRTFLDLVSVKAATSDTLGAINTLNTAIKRMTEPPQQMLRAFDDSLETRIKEVWISRNSDFLAEAYNLRGVLKLAIGNQEGAIQDFDKSIETDHLFFLPRYNVGKVFFDRKDYGNALIEFNQILKFNRDEPGALYWRAKIKLEMNQLKSAKKDLKLAAKLGVLEAKELLAELSN
ncbi:MAG: tetratricopeptide repeat protein [Reichenbachiella sp.]|uniref:tetratricopeptide repeat protein n=1 Tax=Reichenbachiella sp. TaxID=2184521 RepID=UPI0032637CBB